MPRIKQGEHSTRTYGQGRCRYCNKLFTKTKPNKVFCSLLHQKAYNREGMALGPLREKLPKWIAKEVAKQLAELWDRRIAGAQREKEDAGVLFPAKSFPGGSTL